MKVDPKFLEELKNDPNVREKDCGNGIKCYNFTRKAFLNDEWNERTIRARGFFVKDDTDIICRGFNKFFELKESDELQFPVRVMPKMNGYLGLISAVDGELFYATKGSCDPDSEYVQRIREFMEWNTQASRDQLADYLERNDLTVAVEVISSDDPHIVNYEGTIYEDELCFLNLIHNSVEGDVVDPNVVDDFPVSWINMFSYPSFGRGVYCVINNREELDEELEIIAEQANEGAVIIDASGKMYKFKTRWYKEWKRIRGRIPRVSAGKARSHWEQQQKEFGFIDHCDIIDLLINSLAAPYKEKFGHELPIVVLQELYDIVRFKEYTI